MNFAIIIFLQTFGIIVPILGIAALLRKEQSKTSTYLMLANIACLIINGCYYLIITAKLPEAIMLVYKVQVMGSGIFYFFFLMFVTSYLQIDFKSVFKYAYAIVLASSVYCFWSGDYYGLVYESIKFHKQLGFDIFAIEAELGVVSQIQYALTCTMLMILIVFSLRRLHVSKEQSDRNNIGRLIGSQFIVLLSLVFMLMYNLSFDIIPLSASLSVFAIIISVIKGEFFSVAEYGRNWIFDNIDNAFIIVDNAYGYVDSNAYARKVFPELSDLESREPISFDIRTLFSSFEPVVNINNRYYDVRVTKLIDENELEGRCLILADITNQHQLMEELIIEKERAEEANVAKSRFMSNMSHEIRTPMNAIVGMSEVLMRSELPAQEKSYLQNIKNSGEALLTIINDILDFSKIESGKLEIVEDYYEPSSMLSDLAMICLNRIGDKPIELIFDIDHRMPQRLYGDTLRIRQVMINFMNNAIKFTDKGYVKLGIKVLSINEEEIEFETSVTDTGQGIKEEDLEKLFESFSQVDTKKNREKEGTGLGLAISKQLVELMNGTVGVRSVYGEGSTFYFIIKQKIGNATHACELKLSNEEKEKLVVASYLSSPLLKEQLVELCTFNDLKCVEFDINHPIKADYLFIDADAYSLCNGSICKFAKDMKIILIQNPMQGNVWDNNLTILNKPLYCISFANAINGKSTKYESVNTNFLNFIAPKAKVLIVDDNEMNLKVAKSLLAPLQMQIETATNGKEAIDMIESKIYDLVFMDHMMPVMDGVEATKYIRTKMEDYYQKLPIIALSANAIVEAKKEFKNAGMNDFVAKPIEIRQICNVIRKWLNDELIVEEKVVLTNDISHEMIEIKNIDVSEGIKNSGSYELFISLLGDFYKIIDFKSQKIDNCLADGLIKDYTIEVHALKNTSRMIGAIELSKMFLELELNANEGNIELLREKTPTTLELYRSYKPILKPYADLQEGEKEEANNDILLELIKLIQDATNEFDLDTIDEAMKKLDNFSVPSKYQTAIDELRVYISDVSMEEILELTENLITQILNEK